MFGKLIARLRRRTPAHLYPDADDPLFVHDFQQRKRQHEVEIVRRLRLESEAEDRRYIRAMTKAAAEHRRQMLAMGPEKPKRRGINWVMGWKR